MSAENRPAVRLAEPEDLERAWTIVAEYNEAVGVVERDDRQSFGAYLRPPRAFWLAEYRGSVAGCVALRPLEGREEAACEVKRLYVRPPYLRRGVATALMDAAERHAQAAGYAAIYLDTFAALSAAVRLYAGRGYERVARFNDNSQATIFMRRDLR